MNSQVFDDPIERIILRSMNEGVLTIECNGNIHLVNPAASRILGFTEAELVGRKFQDAFSAEPDSDGKGFPGLVMEVISKGTPTVHHETHYLRRDGQWVDLSLDASYLEVDACEPGMENMVIVFRDITPLKALERAKRRAVNHLAHELNTPLSILEASVRTLEQSSTGDGGRADRALKRMNRHLWRLANIQRAVEDILTPRVYRPQSMSLRGSIEEILGEIRLESKHRDVIIDNEVLEGRAGYMDPQILSLVLRTLVKNSIEATPDSGRVTISGTFPPEGFQLTVTDHGIGIPVSDQEFVFEGFHHTQETDEYSTGNPYDFGAGGKGLELLRLKTLAEQGFFDISFDSRHCLHVRTGPQHCPGNLAHCEEADSLRICELAGGTRFSVLFRKSGPPRNRVQWEA